MEDAISHKGYDHIAQGVDWGSNNAAQVLNTTFNGENADDALVCIPSPLEKLPQVLQLKVYDRLDYQSRIHLSTTNRYFHKVIQPQTADESDKLQFIMRAASHFPQHRPSEKGCDYKPGNFECYVCFRVRSPDHFDILQSHYAYVDAHGHLLTDRNPIAGVDRQISLRRFCIECGVGVGLHAPLDCLFTRTGRGMWLCKCRRIWPKPGCLHCPDCHCNCPLRPKERIDL